MTRTDCDVLVIGAGPAGCAAGISLARAGAKVVVVDRARFPRPKTCGDALSNRAIHIVEELGAGDALHVAPQATVRGSAALFPDGTRVARSYGDAPGCIVGRFDLDDLLRRTLGAAGATVVEGVHVRQLTREGARVVGAEAEGHAWRAKGVIAADGHGSVAWTSLDAPRPRGAALGISATGYFEGVAPLETPGYSEHYFERELPCGYSWIFPPVDGTTNMGVYLRCDAYEAQGVPLAKLYSDFIARHPERFSGARQIGKVRSWSLPLAGPRRRAGAGGLLVCGDAGRYIDPLTGEGIWQSLFTGRLAGTLAAESLRRGGIDAAAVREFRRECALRVDWPSGVRERIQDGMRWIVAGGLYRSPAVRAVLQWGFGSGSLELSKTVS